MDSTTLALQQQIDDLRNDVADLRVEQQRAAKWCVYEMTEAEQRASDYVRAMPATDRMALLIISICQSRRETRAMARSALGLILHLAHYLKKENRVVLAEQLRDGGDLCEHLEQEQSIIPVD